MKLNLRILGFALLPMLAVGCSTTSTAPTTRASDIMAYDSLPTAVQSAFVSQHTYAEVDSPTTEHDANGETLYVIPYTQPQGDREIAKYTADGVAK